MNDALVASHSEKEECLAQSGKIEGGGDADRGRDCTPIPYQEDKFLSFCILRIGFAAGSGPGGNIVRKGKSGANAETKYIF